MRPIGFQDDTLLTTGHVADLCQVAPRTAAKWIDSGKLKGFPIPGSRDRRVRLDVLRKFMAEHHLPTERLERLPDGRAKVMVVTQDEAFQNDLIRSLGTASIYLVCTSGAFDAGRYLGGNDYPAVAVIDFAIGTPEAESIVNGIRKKTAGPRGGSFILAVKSDRDDPSGGTWSGCHETFTRPLDTDLLAERIRTLAGV